MTAQAPPPPVLVNHWLVSHLPLSHFLERCSDQRVGRAVGGVPVGAAYSSRHRVHGAAVLGMEQRVATAMDSGGLAAQNHERHTLLQ